MDQNSKISDISRLNEFQKRALKKLGIETASDLLYHFPVRYGDSADIRNIADLKKGDSAVVFGQLSGLKTSKAFRKKIPMAEAWLEDATGKIKIVWFHQPYLAKMLGQGSAVRAEGKVSDRKGELYLSNPKTEKLESLPVGGDNLLFEKDTNVDFLYPVYPESRGVTSNWFYHTIQKIFSAKGAAPASGWGFASGGKSLLDNLEEFIPTEILDKYHLPSLKTALIWIHAPKNQNDAAAARKRFAFEEIFLIQLERQKTRLENQKQKTFSVKADEESLQSFIKKFPFTPTPAQSRAISIITENISKPVPMSRLLEGDVGSGKTAVAASAAFATVNSRPGAQDFGNLQVAYMAPTEILAKQHFESFIEYFTHLGINIGLITGSGCRKFPSKVNPKSHTDISRAQLLKWVANGEIPVLVGTHALIQKSVVFKHLALVIIDEQHRFGTAQRAKLVARGTDAEHTQNYAEKNADELVHKDLTYIIRSALFEVRKNLGGGHKEIIYQRAVAEELDKAKLHYTKEARIPILYNKKQIGIYQPDFVIEDKIILELKALSFVGQTEKKQLWTYLKGSNYRLALLVNFGPTELTINRVIYDKARNQSASVPHISAPLPHMLSMTATPIPRTLALTIYGDLDLTLLDEMPAGRKPIITEIIYPDKRAETYANIRKELLAGRQLYVICPRIDEPDPTKEMAILAKSVKEEAKRLKKEVFPEYEINILHSKMNDSEKESAMKEFKAGKINILVATSVVEVGVNVPNATVIIIEGAERFGLAQLHQLRGRVVRSNHQAYCYVFSETKSGKSADRLKALKQAKNGFELAELDLKLRGAGELYGMHQWGISDVGMEALKNLKMVEAARAEALALVEKDPELTDFPLLSAKLSSKRQVHFE